MEKHELAKQDYLSGMKNKGIAAKYGVSENTLKSWIRRGNWRAEKDALKKGAPQKKKDAPKKEEVATTEIVIENDELNDKQILFCLEFIKCHSPTKAYQRVYECSYQVAWKNGYKFMAHYGIKKEIERLKKIQRESRFLSADDILQRHIDIAFSNITDFVSFGSKGNTNYVNLHDSKTVDGSLITEVKEGKDGVSIKLADKMKSLDFLTKHFDLLSENDRKRLQDEKLKLEIEKKQAEIEVIKGPKEGEGIKDWKQAVIEAANKRKEKENE